MKILNFEIKKQLFTATVWAVAMVATLILLITGVYPIFMESVDSVLTMLKGFPPEFSAAFGMNLEKMFSFGGFYAFCFTYISLMGAIMAASLAIASFSRETRSKCSEFLLTKPVSRESIFAQKLLSGLGLLVATNAVYIIIAVLIGRDNDTDMFLASLSLFLTQLVFFAIGIFYATFAKKVRSVSGMATVFGFVAFILSALVNILEEEVLRFVTPLKYFDPIAVFADGRYEIKYAVTGIVVALICVILSYLRFVKSDTKSV